MHQFKDYEFRAVAAGKRSALTLVAGQWLAMRYSGVAQLAAAAARGDEGEDDEPRGYLFRGGLAVITVEGPLTKRGRWWLPTSLREVEASVAAAADAADVHSILLLIDSPGGEIAGLQQAHDAIRAASRRKRVHAHVDDLAASAGYWLACAADSISINPGGMAGCIGVYTVLADTTKAWQEYGVELHLVSTGEVKGLGADGKVTKELLADAQREITEAGEQFVATVAAGRGMSVEDARKLMTGQCWGAQECLEKGLVDAVANLGDVVNGLHAGVRLGDVRFLSAGASKSQIDAKQKNSKKPKKGVDPQVANALDIGATSSDSNGSDTMDPEKIKAWFATEAGKAFHDEVVDAAVAERIEAGKLLTPDVADAKAAEARAEQKKLDAEAKQLDDAVKAIHAIDKVMPEKDIKAELEKYAPGATRDAHIARMKAEAQVTAMKNVPVAGGTTKTDATNEKDLRAEFDKRCASGEFGDVSNEAVKAIAWREFKAQRKSKNS